MSDGGLWPQRGPLVAGPAPPRGAQATPPRAYLHGFTLVPEMWGAAAAAAPAAASYWVRLPGHATARSPSPRCAAAAAGDEPGAGEAGEQRRQARFVAVVDAVAGALGRAAGEPLHLIGYSMGARLALALALRHPAQVAALSLVGVQPGLADAAARAARRREEAGWQQALLRGGTAAFMDWWERQGLLVPRRALPAARRQQLARWRRRHRPEGLAACLAVAGLAAMPDYGPALATLAAPTLFVAGAADERFAALAHAAAARAPRGRAALVAGAGHNPVCEAPQATAALLAAWPPR